MWEMRWLTKENDNLYDGVPFMTVAREIFECHSGSRREKKAEEAHMVIYQMFVCRPQVFTQ
jgi:hypothetical protein